MLFFDFLLAEKLCALFCMAGAGADVGIRVCVCDVHFAAIINYFQKFVAHIHTNSERERETFTAILELVEPLKRINAIIEFVFISF